MQEQLTMQTQQLARLPTRGTWLCLAVLGLGVLTVLLSATAGRGVVPRR